MPEAEHGVDAHNRRVAPARHVACALLAILATHPVAVRAASTSEAVVAPDLVVQRVEYMDCVPRVGVTVYNQGDAPVVTPFDVRLTSLSPAYGPTGNAVQSVGGLGAFSGTRVVFSLPSYDTGSAAADPSGVVTEANDRNNELKVAAHTIVPCPTISMSGAAAEGSSVRIGVRISHAFTQPVRASYVTEDRSAVGADFGVVARGTTTCGGDFIRGRGTVEFPTGTSELVQFIDVPTCIDGTKETLEQFSIRLTEIVNGHLPDAAAGVAVAHIADGAQ